MNQRFNVEIRRLVGDADAWSMLEETETLEAAMESYLFHTEDGVLPLDIRIVEVLFDKQREAGRIEPKVVLLGRDRFAAAVLREWVRLHLVHSGEPGIANVVLNLAQKMDDWRLGQGLDVYRQPPREVR